jgi:chitinase
VQGGTLDLSASGDTQGLQTFVQTAHSHNVKALVSIGGWSGSEYWSTNVATADSRQQFVQTVTDFAKTYSLDGIDIESVLSLDVPSRSC